MKKSPRSLFSSSLLIWSPSLVAIVLSAVVAISRAQAQAPGGKEGKLPPFLKVDGLRGFPELDGPLATVACVAMEVEEANSQGRTRIFAAGTSGVNATSHPGGDSASHSASPSKETNRLNRPSTKSSRCP